jgi:hypothetical protein
MALVEAARFYNSLEAGVARSRLESEGIDSVLFDVELNYGVLPIRLMVDEDDLAEAVRSLA